MASITSMMNSSYNTSSIYGSRNVLSGLASGMDTESMIENAVSGIKAKIERLTQQRTKVEWQQDAYRSIIDKAVNFSNKYTSYSSKTNLMSPSFFSNAVNTTTSGTYADKITASGKTSSDIRINSVKQMATAASYTVSGLGGRFTGIAGIDGREAFDIKGSLDVSTVSGSLTLQYGGSNGASFDIKFDELEDLNEVEVLNADGTVKKDASEGEKLAQAIQNKLGEITYSYTKNGFQESTTADKAIKVEVDPFGRITFQDGLGNGNSVKISSSSGKIKQYAGDVVLTTPGRLTVKEKTSDYLADKELSVNLNGTTKKISMNDVLDGINYTYDASKGANEQFMDNLQRELDDAFGKGKVTASRDADGKLSFTPKGEGDTLYLGGTAVKALGFESGDANYINTGKKLSDLMGEDIFDDKNKIAAVGTVKPNSTGKYSVDEKGNRVSMGDDGKYYRVNSDGEFLYNFEINGANINVTKDTTLESLMNSINSNADAGVKVSYSKLTNEFKFTATETGSNGRIEFGGLAKDMFAPSGRFSNNFSETYGLGLQSGQSKQVKFTVPGVAEIGLDGITKDDTMEDIVERLNSGGALKGLGYTASYNETSGQILVTDKTGKMVELKASTEDGQELEPKLNSSYTTGQDAVMDVEINGKRFENLTRSSNSFDLDGLTINVKGTFDEVGKDGADYEPVTFTTTTDSDKIVEAIQQFVDDYNEMATELKNAYSTMPAQKSDGSRYDPLTATQEENYSESERAAYEEKAKQGVLFGDSTLSSMYSKLLSAITPGGTDGQTLREIGIGTSYSNGMTTLSLDEDKLRAALESNPDKVKDAFTKSRESGSSSDGLMTTMKNTLDTYVKTTGEPKGVLIQHAGSVKAYTSLNNNSLKSKMDSIDKQIERWQDKMSTQIDRYTTQFSRLEQLIAEMNSQASTFSGLMGGSTGY